MSFFQKSKIELEKTLHHSLLQRPPTRSCGPYLYALIFIWGCGHVQTIMLRIGVFQYRRTDGPTDGPTDGGGCLGEFLDG